MKLKCDSCDNEAVTVCLVGGAAKPQHVMQCASCRFLRPPAVSFTEVTTDIFLKFILPG